MNFYVQVDVQKIIELVAKDSEAKGLHEDAVHLYELAKDETKVIELLCRLLSGSISQPATMESESWRVQNRALAFAQRLKASGSLLPNIASSFFLLLDLGIFFSLYHEEKYHEAFDVSQNNLVHLITIKLHSFFVSLDNSQITAYSSLPRRS